MEDSHGILIYKNNDENKALLKWKQFIILFVCLVNGCTAVICLLLVFKGNEKDPRILVFLILGTAFVANVYSIGGIKGPVVFAIYEKGLTLTYRTNKQIQRNEHNFVYFSQIEKIFFNKTLPYITVKLKYPLPIEKKTDKFGITKLQIQDMNEVKTFLSRKVNVTEEDLNVGRFYA
jgi:hypothetical protein